jgi:hypothetical protein
MTEYLLRHWRGQFPLGRSCGTNGALVMLAFAAWFELAGGYLVTHPPIRLLVFLPVLVLPFFVFLAVAAWSGVGIWRSAGRRIDFARPFWGWIARAAVVLGVAILILAAIMLVRAGGAILSARANATVAAYEVSLRGNTAVFHGEITSAAADELELLLKDKSVKRLALAGSSGGDLGQALRLAKLIQDRKLFVVALAQCDAACTLLLAAGKVRAVVPDTIMGFAAEPDSAMRLYRQAGLGAAFVDSLRKNPPDALFEPALYNLIASGFLTDIFVAAERHYISAPKWCARNLTACGRSGRQNMDAEKNSGGNRNGK